MGLLHPPGESTGDGQLRETDGTTAKLRPSRGFGRDLENKIGKLSEEKITDSR